MPDRCTPEYERVVAKMGGLLPYRRARTLLSEFLLPDDARRWKRPPTNPLRWCQAGRAGRRGAAVQAGGGGAINRALH
jgi:hypothetical protein